MKIYHNKKTGALAVVPDKGYGSHMVTSAVQRGYNFICMVTGAYDAVQRYEGQTIYVLNNSNTIKTFLRLKITDEYRIKELEKKIDLITTKLSTLSVNI